MELQCFCTLKIGDYNYKHKKINCKYLKKNILRLTLDCFSVGIS